MRATVLAVLLMAGCSRAGAAKGGFTPRGMEDLAAAEVAVGSNHACARSVDGRVACWGRDNGYGQLGVGGTSPSAEPLDVRLSGVVEITAGFQHTCARDGDGAVYCWGEGTHGAIGDGARTDRDRPRRVPLDPAARIFASETTTCARLRDGALRCWGHIPAPPGSPDEWGRIRPAPEPTEMPTGLTDVVSFAAGGASRCVVNDGGEVRCWGEDTLVVSDGSAGVDHAVTIQLPRPATDVAMGVGLACARVDTGEVYCWGYATRGWLGAEGLPVATTLSGEGLTGGERALCAIHQGHVRCIGRGVVVVNDEPVRLSTEAADLPLSGGFVAVGVGVDELCAVRDDHRFLCVEVREPPPSGEPVAHRPRRP